MFKKTNMDIGGPILLALNEQEEAVGEKGKKGRKGKEEGRVREKGGGRKEKGDGVKGGEEEKKLQLCIVLT